MEIPGINNVILSYPILHIYPNTHHHYHPLIVGFSRKIKFYQGPTYNLEDFTDRTDPPEFKPTVSGKIDSVVLQHSDVGFHQFRNGKCESMLISYPLKRRQRHTLTFQGHPTFTSSFNYNDYGFLKCLHEVVV